MRRILRNEDAATMPEYALMVALIALVCVLAVSTLGLRMRGPLNRITAAIGGP
jgi:pilus assembly protein Flp/PilA